jgi:Mce-associated membrane protein
VIASEVVAETGGEARGRRPRLLLAALAVATVLLGGFGVFATVEAHSLRTAASGANGALVDRSATSSVERAVTGAVNTIFSYSYADVGKTRAAAQKLLTGHAVRQYDQLFALVERQAPKEKLVVATKVTNVGVELLGGGSARVLVFANQQDNRAGTSQASYAGAMFAVTAVRREGRWLIENIDTFTTGT